MLRAEGGERLGGEVGHLRLPGLVPVQLVRHVLDGLLQRQDGIADVQVPAGGQKLGLRSLANVRSLSVVQGRSEVSGKVKGYSSLSGLRLDVLEIIQVCQGSKKHSLIIIHTVDNEQ